MPQTSIHPTANSTPHGQSRKMPSLSVSVDVPPKVVPPNDVPLDRLLELDSAVQFFAEARLEIVSTREQRSRAARPPSSTASVGPQDNTASGQQPASRTNVSYKIKQHNWMACSLVLSDTSLHILKKSAGAGKSKTSKASSSSSPRFASMSPRRLFSKSGKSSPLARHAKGERSPFISVSADLAAGKADTHKKRHPSLDTVAIDTVPLTRLYDLPKVMCFSPCKGMHTIELHVRQNEIATLNDNASNTVIRLCFASEAAGSGFQAAITQATRRLRDIATLTEPGQRAPWLSEQVRLVAAHGIITDADPDMPDVVLTSPTDASCDALQLRASSCARARVLFSTIHGVRWATIRLHDNHEVEVDLNNSDSTSKVVYSARLRVAAATSGECNTTAKSPAVVNSVHTYAAFARLLAIGAIVCVAVCAAALLCVREMTNLSGGSFDDYMMVAHLLSSEAMSSNNIMSGNNALVTQTLVSLGHCALVACTWKLSVMLSSVVEGFLSSGKQQPPSHDGASSELPPQRAWRLEIVNVDARVNDKCEAAAAVTAKQESGKVVEKPSQDNNADVKPMTNSWGFGDAHLIGAPVQDTPENWVASTQGDVAAGYERWQASLVWRRDMDVDKLTQSKPRAFDVVKAQFPHAFIGEDLQGNLISMDTFTGIKAGVRAMAAAGVTQQDYAMHMVYLNEYYLGRSVGKTGRLFKIMDLKGVRVSDLSKDVIAYLSEANRTLQNYPEVVHSIVLVNAPSYFSLIWRVVSPLLNKITASKIKVFSARSHNAARTHLLGVIDAQVLPVLYGGDLDVKPSECEMEQEFLRFVNNTTRTTASHAPDSSSSSGGDSPTPVDQ